MSMFAHIGQGFLGHPIEGDLIDPGEVVWGALNLKGAGDAGVPFKVL